MTVEERMRLWTAMLGAWLAAGTGTATGDAAGSAQGARQAGSLAPRPVAERVVETAALPRPDRREQEQGSQEKGEPEAG